MTSRSRPRALLAAALIAVLLAACDGEDTTVKPPLDTITYATGFGVAPREAYAFIAQDLGFFSDAGLTVTIQPAFPDQIPTLLADGEVDVAAVDSAGMTIRHGLGTEDHTVVISASQQISIAALMSFTISNPSGLEGATIGAVNGGITETLFPEYAQSIGIDSETVTWEHMAGDQLATALATGKVDAIALFATDAPVLAAAAGQDPYVHAYSDSMTDLYGTVHITTRDLVTTNPDLVRRVNSALLRGLQYAIEHPDAAGEILRKHVPEADAAVAAAVYEALEPYATNLAGPLGGITETRAVHATSLLQALGIIPDGSIQRIVPEMYAWEVIPGGGEG